jgi:phosphatidylglycerol lysyltransferase
VSLERARALVLEHGWNATAYQIVNPGIRHWFSSVGDAVVGYVEAAGVRVVAGAPVCALDRLPDVAAEFEAGSRADGFSVCYFGAEGRLEAVYRGSALHSMALLGAQPVWDPREWEAICARHASLRAQFNRARNKGVAVHEWPVAMAEGHPGLRRCLDEWLSTRGLPPLHFLVEPQTLARLAGRRVFVATRGPAVIAFLVASPVPARQGWLVEQCVRGHEAVNGTTDLLVNAAMRTFAAESSEFVTLGLAPLSQHVPPLLVPPEPLWLRFVLGWVRLHGRRFYNFAGLDRFKARLRPVRWDPVYAIAARPHFPPGMLYAIAGAFSGGSPVLLVARGLGRAVMWELTGRPSPVADG